LARLRVLFLATRDSAHPGVAGGDINMWECARYLASKGHNVTFVASKYPGSPHEETLDGVHIVRLGGIRTLWLTSFWFYITKGRNKCDVVVAEGFGGSRIPRLTPLYVKEPILTEWRQVHRRLFEEQYARPVAIGLTLLERATAFFHRKTTVLAYTPEGKEAFVRIGFRPENIVVVPVSIRSQWLSTVPAGSVEAPNIIWLGKFRRYKCPHHVILAMREVASVIPQSRLIVAGRHDDTRYETGLRRLVARLGLNSNVEFQFDLTEEDKMSALKRSRVMALPSSVEGFGIVVLEANACGVPVVASSGVPESVVGDGINGLRYPFGDASALARSLLRILTDDDLYRRLSAGGLRSAPLFTWERAGSAFETTVRRLADVKGSRSAIAPDTPLHPVPSEKPTQTTRRQ
jgi:glycosyltransferase involved in cell wall biosynthesis